MPKPDARRSAFDVLTRVETGAFADLALSAALDALADARDRGLATELVYGVLRRQGKLDFALARFCKQPLPKLEPAVLRLLRLGAYQLLELDRVPARAAVHASVELARELGLQRATGFINGVLRSLDRGRSEIPWPDPERQPLACLEQSLSLPHWLARRWLTEMGAAEALALGEALQAPAPFCLRVNTLRCSREALLTAFAAAGHEVAPTAFAPEGIVLLRRADAPLPGEAEGWFQVQDEASMLIPHLLGAQPGEMLLDTCAAPGGKTTQLAALTANQARITALDLHPQRAALVANGAARLGCKEISVRAWDMTRRPDFIAAGSIDRILVDAPCSGLGVLRRNPELRWRRQPDDPRRLAGLQGSILASAAPLLKPGGHLLYSVCTQTDEETVEVVAAFLAAHPEYAREDLRPLVPEHWRPLFDGSGALRTLPHQHDGMDAFWAVRLQRQS
ncbi:16S rRNA (cytosine(967)-C(5))-methyltransferase RsmB [Desulfuromonas carbonis]|uniref:16S rRNA (cytosine(967)-C(5))-methyltransferase RsmB n=1 Tax=Desulfuromonas sp. DDH964 TaxID=1823759 RepID=UPI00078EA507|nr:16S rRNA (cytosine(967)-C(5))-methyltransferase RsmB [Desulfuromonas sp. DDH964]AMV71050.1 16S rRNA (5-methyl-C967)-methyltransferase [Desulfuromonas sp. DDH964]